MNLSPRVGGAYDLFGDGRTAVKFSLGRYPVQTEQATANPARNLNGQHQPDVGRPEPQLLARLRTGEFGGQRGVRPFVEPQVPQARWWIYTWRRTRPRGSTGGSHHFEGTVSVQHELARGLGLNVGYYRTCNGGFLAMQNLAAGAADYDEFCITAPTDSRLGPYSGREVCGLYDVNAGTVRAGQ